jgi:serine/threonine protein kinase
MIDYKYYGLRHDVWGLGILSYFLFAGQFPWNGENDLEICDAIQKEKLDLDILKKRKVDSKIIDCIRGMLTKDPSKRLTIRQVMAHKMFQAFHKQGDQVTEKTFFNKKRRSQNRSRI